MELMRAKTGALLAASVAGGALCAGARAEEVYPIGLDLGLAFQIADDVLDLTSDAATLGKTPGKDVAQGKSTLPALVGLDEARRRAQALLDAALARLEPLGEGAEALRALSRHILARKK
jgi:farnesyl diphosphate synthase/geranylgeranyl diphosphate synthase type II